MPYSTASNKTDKFGNVLKSSIAQLVYKKKMDKMMEVPFNLNNPFRGEIKSMEHNGYWNPNRNDKQEKQNLLIINLRHSQWNNEQKSVVLLTNTKHAKVI